ncbi:MAG: histidine phosphotransferase family protein [Pseudomonadota bacterium]
MTDQDITALVSSRICHDLISPIGAISNGVELLTGTSSNVSPELGMIGDSVNSATDRLRCFRIAFGAAPARAELPIGEVTNAVEALFGGRSSVQTSLPGNAMSRVMAKTILLTLLCQEKCLPMGGQTSVTADASSFRLHTVTTRLKDCDTLWAIVEGQPAEIDFTPGEVQFPLLADLLQQTDAQLTRSQTEEELTIEVTGLGS